MSPRALLCVLAVGAALTCAVAPALADPPWAAPQPLAGVDGGALPAVATPAGNVVVLGAVVAGAPGHAVSGLVRVGGDGTPRGAQTLDLADGHLATTGADGVVVAGSTLVGGTVTDASRVAVATGTAAGGVGAPRAIAGTTGERVFGVAGNARGDVALVVGAASRVRDVELRRAGATSFARVLHLPVSALPRAAAIALGARGDLLVTWEDQHHVYARHRGVHGTWGATHRVGDGVQTLQQPLVSPQGRLSLAYKSQRVSEGEAATNPEVRFATAAPGRGWGPARLVEAPGVAGTGHAVADPAVRLVADVGERALLAWTGFADGHFVVRASAILEGHLQPAQTLTPAGQDAVLAAADAVPGGRAAILARTGVAGTDAIPGAAQDLVAAVRDPGAAAFGAAETIAATPAGVVSAPGLAVDPVSGHVLAAFMPLAPGAVPQIAVR